MQSITKLSVVLPRGAALRNHKDPAKVAGLLDLRPAPSVSLVIAIVGAEHG